MAQKKARSSKNTYWNQKRVDAKITLQELSEYLGIDYTQLSHYLTGQLMPPTDVVIKLCDLFGVDLESGTAEFESANRCWNHAHKKVIPTRNMPEISVTLENNDELFRYLYGVLSYDEFKSIIINKYTKPDLLKVLYGKVDFNTYIELSKILDK